jgi:hypothetical protein
LCLHIVVSRYRVQRFKVQGSRLKVQGSRFRVQRLENLEFEVSVKIVPLIREEVRPLKSIQ